MGNPFGTSVDGRSADRHNKTSKGGQVVKVQDGKEVKMHITLGLKTPSQIADMVFTTVHGNVDQKGVPYQIVDIDVFKWTRVEVCQQVVNQLLIFRLRAMYPPATSMGRRRIQ